MKKILYLALVLFSINISGQNILSKAQLEKLPKNKKDLYLRINRLDSLQTDRIINYLAFNKNIKRTFTHKNGKVYVMTDVINGKPIYSTTDNDLAAIATGANELHTGGSLGLNLDGSGITIGVWDGGPVQNTHTEFLNTAGTDSRITNVESANTEGGTDIDDHATHVTGTIAARGIDPRAKGMAPTALVTTYNFLNDTQEINSVLLDANNQIFLSNHSYGFPIDQGDGTTLDSWDMGAYAQKDAIIDDIARNNPDYLMVVSAGNDGLTSYDGGLSSNLDKLTGASNAKNNLVVANAAVDINPFTREVNSFTINTSSSQGPTDDLRIKPDIAGDGTFVYSTIPTDSYGPNTGTSMSAPNVTGSLALLQQYYNNLHGAYMNAATLKALACHSATDDALTIGPDPYFGWGLLNVKAAAEIIQQDNNDASVIDALSLTNGSTYNFNFSVQAGQKLSATICWTDVRGAAAIGETDLNNPLPRLINDLDLRLVKNGTSFFPWKLENVPNIGITTTTGDNFRDNVERIDIEVPEAGNYELIVSHKGTLKGTTPFDPTDQDFSLIITGSFLTLNTQNFDEDVLNVYPNPTSDILTVNSIRQIDKIEVYNALGKLILQKKGTKTVDLSNVSKGLYILKIDIDGVIVSKKLIKK